LLLLLLLLMLLLLLRFARRLLRCRCLQWRQLFVALKPPAVEVATK